MIRVLRLGAREAVTNPLDTRQQTFGRKVTFIEDGERGGINSSVANTSRVLDQLIADEIKGLGIPNGLANFRIHTQFVEDHKLGSFPIGRILDNAFINRKLFSTPQIAQQANVKPRMIDGDPTFFLTEISTTPEDDDDRRLSRETVAKLHPEYFSGDIVSQTTRRDTFDEPTAADIASQMDESNHQRDEHAAEVNASHAQMALSGADLE